jgi:hypothetical protein
LRAAGVEGIDQYPKALGMLAASQMLVRAA